MKGGPLETLKNFVKKTSHTGKGESLILTIGKGAPFWVLYFKLEAFGCAQNQLLSTFGKSV